MNLNQWIIVSMMCIIFMLLLIGFFLLFRSLRLAEIAKQNMHHIMERLYNMEEKRVLQAELERRRYGTTARDGKASLLDTLLDFMEDKIIYSGLKAKLQWLNVWTAVCILILLWAAGFFLGFLIYGLLGGALLGAVIPFLPMLYLTIMSERNYSNTEKQITFFISMVSATAGIESGNLLILLERCAPRMANPIRDSIYRAVSTWKITGNVDEGIRQLIRQVEYPLFKDFIKQLDICSKQDASFQNIAEDFQKQAEITLSSIERLRAIHRGARNQVILMMVLGLVIPFITANMFETNLLQVIENMRQSIAGLGILCLEIGIYVVSAIYAFLGGNVKA